MHREASTKSGSPHASAGPLKLAVDSYGDRITDRAPEWDSSFKLEEVFSL